MGSDSGRNDYSAQRAFIALLFADVCEYTRLAELLDPEDVFALRERIQELTRRVVEQHHGLVNQYVGDGAVAAFGLTSPDEHAARRAIEASLDLRGRLAQQPWHQFRLPLDFAVQMHFGVDAGLVFARPGDPLHGRFELTGSPANTAARLCAQAGPGEVLVSEAALVSCRCAFEIAWTRRLDLKGLARPVQTHRVLGLGRSGAKPSEPNAPFTGRREVLAWLQEAEEQALQARDQIRVLVGDAGMGKTRMLDELARDSRLPVLRGRAESYGGSVPLQSFLPVIAAILAPPEDLSQQQARAFVARRVANLNPELQAHLGEFLELLGFGSPRRLADRGDVAPVASLIQAATKRDPTLLILDDWQWADDASARVLGMLASQPQKSGLFVLIGCRKLDDNPLLLRQPRMKLEPLDLDHARTILHALLGRTLPERLVSALHAHSGGNPLFLQELARTAAEQGLEDGQELDGVPATVHAVVSARIARLPEPARRLLQLASVVGLRCSLELLRQLESGSEPPPDHRPLLSALQRTGLVRSLDAEGAFEFCHGTLREAVYLSVPAQLRRAVHRQVAECLQLQQRGDDSAEVHLSALALHLTRGERPEEAALNGERAADLAAARSALDQARRAYRQVLDNLERLPQNRELDWRWLNVAGRWARTGIFNPSRSQLGVLDSATLRCERLGDHNARAEVRHWRSWIHYALGEQDEATESLQRAFADLESGRPDEALRAQLLVSLGQSRAAAGDYEPALRALDEGIELKRLRALRTQRPRLPLGCAYAIGCRAMVYADRGEFPGARLGIGEALSLVEGSRHALYGSLLGLMAMIQLWQGDWAAALATAERGRASGERVNGRYVQAMCSVMEGYGTWALRGDRTALASMHRAIRWLEDHDCGLFLSFAQAHLAQALEAAGKREAALEAAQRALVRARKGDTLGEATAHRCMSRCHLADGRTELARQHLEAARQSGQRRHSERELALTKLCEAQLHLETGSPALGRQLALQSAEQLQALGVEGYALQANRLAQAAPPP